MFTSIASSGIGHDALASSTDGVHWQTVTLPTVNKLSAVNHSTHTLLLNAISKRWPLIKTQLNNNALPKLNDIIWITSLHCAQKLCLATGISLLNDETIVYRYDARQTTPHWQVAHQFRNIFVDGIAAANGVWVMNGTSIIANTHQAKLLVSQDNTNTWKIDSVPSTPLNQELLGIATNGQQWVTVADEGGECDSINHGLNWHCSASVAKASRLQSIAVNNNGQWLALGADAAGDDRLFHATYTNGAWQWSMLPTSAQPKLSDADELETIKWVNNKQWLIATVKGNIFTSTDGKTWTPVNSHTNSALMAFSTQA